MSSLEILLVALSLALDVGVVSVGAGALNALNARRMLLIALLFSVAHAAAPFLGWWVGYLVSDFALAYGKLIGFILLLLVGLKMLRDALKGENEERERNLFDAHVLLLLVLATSIDAFVIGITFNFLKVVILDAAIVIGLVTFAVSLLGSLIGRKTRHLAGTKIELIGALALIGLAFKVLLF